MKPKHLLFLTLFLMAGIVRGETNIFPVYGTNFYCPVLTNLNSNAPMTIDSAEHVHRLARAGEICKVFGHWWRIVPHVTLEYRPDGNYPEHRKCILCGKSETKTEEWK
jgi:hypothetical protein